MPVEKRTLKSSAQGGSRRFLAAAATLALAGTGILTTTVPAIAAPEPVPSASCIAVNPMGAATPVGSENGYTIFVSENAILANSELEGTLAVGDTAIFGDSRSNQSGQYPIVHGGVGGNADYSVPTIAGEPNRVLIQKFASKDIKVQVKALGAAGANAEAGVKIGDHNTPANYTFGPMFDGSGTTFFPADGGNMSPQIDSIVQQWTDLATAEQSWGLDGDVLSHFSSDKGTSVIEAFTDWQAVDAPKADDQTVALSPNGPSKLPLSMFATYSKFKLEGYSEKSFLVITVDPADVVDGRVTLPSYSFAGKDGAQKEGISHILFDFSAINGEVEVVSPNEPVRGSLYAPNAHIVFPAESDGGREFEGQIIAKNFTALQSGKELHTNLFKGRFPCGEQPTENEGTFNLRKIVDGVDPAAFPAGTTFPVTATWEGGEETFDLPANGTVVPSGLTLPEGTVITLTEGDLPDAPAGYSFESKALSADTITILAGGNADIAWSVTNVYEADAVVVHEGGFNLSKQLIGVNAKNFPASTVFTVTATWTVNGTEILREYTLPVDGSVVAGPRDLPAGTRVTFSEINVPALDGYTFAGVEFTEKTMIIQGGEIANVAATNTYKQSGLAVTGGSAITGAATAGALLLLAGGAALMIRRKFVTS